jgi:Tol biopolymer transport system component
MHTTGSQSSRALRTSFERQDLMRRISSSIISLILIMTLAGCETGDSSTGTAQADPQGNILPRTPDEAPTPVPPEGIAVLARADGEYTPPTEIVQVDVTSTGTPANSTSVFPSLNEDGSIIAFSSRANNLTSGSSGSYYQVYKKDLVEGTVTKMSTNGYEEANYYCYWPSLSPSGEKVAFYSYATNLVSGATVRRARAYVGSSNGMDLACESANGIEANNSSLIPRFGGEDYIAFYSSATNLIPNDTNGSTYDVFVKQVSNGSVDLVTRNTAGQQANSTSYFGDVSADGRYVTFMSYASNLGATGSGYRIYLRDRQLGTTTLISEGLSYAHTPRISGDGSKVAFYGNSREIWVYDRLSDTTTREYEQAYYYPVLSADGRFLAVARYDDPNVPEDNDGRTDIYVKDLATGESRLLTGDFDSSCYYPTISGNGSTVAWYSGHIYLTSNPLCEETGGYTPPEAATIVSLDSGGQGADNQCTAPDLSQDGQYLVFTTMATNLVTNAGMYNSDVLRLDLATGEYHWASRPQDNSTEINGYSEFTPLISPDGQKIVFHSDGSLVPGTTYPGSWMYIRDVVSDTLSLVASQTTSSTKLQSLGGSNFVGFHTYNQLVPQDTGNDYDVYLKDLAVGVYALVSVDSTGARLPGWNEGGWTSADGQTVAWVNRSGPSNSQYSLWIRNLEAGVTSQIEASMGGLDVWNGDTPVAIAADGSTVVYVRNYGQLVSYDVATGIKTVLGQANHRRIALSDAGDFVVYSDGSQSPSGDLVVQNVSSGQKQVLVPEHYVSYPMEFGVAISGDGGTIAYINNDGVDWQTGQVWVVANPLR